MHLPFGAAETIDPATLRALEAQLRGEIPLATHMGVALDRADAAGLWLTMPLAPNRNPHQTAFAGSLNALGALAGWAMTHLLLERLGVQGSTVLRRSSIKYQEPVETPTIAACCQPPRDADWAHFVEMLREKKQGKLDLVVEVAGSEPSRPAVLFAGNYVVTQHGG